ncbi:hypothetical protein O3P69_016317 [Scylla paramamosain]|uniref:Ig-like domain-containing protein n=1 Tax=Scylla paramamosain TaxID=85552 RepID=A0AAW0TDP5_SCYPA
MLRGTTRCTLSKWYRDVNQFYEYIPKREKQVRVYDIPYIHVDEEGSSEGSVRLTGLTRAASGMFRCEVMSDKPYFETDDKAENMTVVDVPAWGPEVMGVVRGAGMVGGGAGEQSVERLGNTRVRPGDIVMARCEAGPSHPPANITWTLNHSLQPPPHARLHNTHHTDQDGRHAQMSELEVEVQESWLGRGVMTLSCHVSISHVYHRTANLTLVHADHPPTCRLRVVLFRLLPRGLADAAAAARLPALLLLLLLLLPQRRLLLVKVAAARAQKTPSRLRSVLFLRHREGAATAVNAGAGAAAVIAALTASAAAVSQELTLAWRSGVPFITALP